MKKTSFHKIILKNTGLFGVSQVLGLLVRLVTNKIAAILIGTLGIGIIGYLTNILNLIKGILDLGLTTSSVREVALVSSSSDKDSEDHKLIKILYRWAWLSGLVGVLLTVIFSKTLSNLIFEDDSYRYWTMLLGLYFVFISVASIRLSVLRGKNKVKSIVLYQLFLSVLSILFTVPFYYFFGLKGIIPSFLGTSFLGFLLSLYFTRNIKVLESKVSNKEFFEELKPMVKLGVLLTVNVVFGQLCFYIIRWYLKEVDSLDILGIYQVGNAFLVSYLGLVFTSMANDYYPSLCNYVDDKKKFNDLINDQTEFALFLVVPAITLLYIFLPNFISLLYSKEFLPAVNILQIGLFSVILKAIIWPIGYISLVKGDKPMYFKQNAFGDALNVILAIVLFNVFSLKGLGLAICVMFVLSGIYVYYGVYKKYGFRYRNDTVVVLLVSVVLALVATLSTFYGGFSIYNPVLVIVFLISTIYSIVHLKNKIF